ncbi:Peptidoglycan-associated lipoprotein precursor [Flavobacterium columnare]|uniref:OmpA family protein n=2 Tax=Flavobacterium TaxID=237 RepID=A0ABW8PK62_9FLAO|nr:OmpA family protein [Flavobacterium columnare]SPE77269.1 Peptidoglycan-associated lipoprotein precursor [Flavobacterium columnare]
MIGGIKKIHYAKGLIFKEKSIPNQILVIAPDEFVWFSIEWIETTPEKEKQRNVVWIWQEGNRKTVLKKTVLNSAMLYGIKIPKKLCGFTYFIEASLSGNRNNSKTNHKGLHISGYCPPRITASKWAVSSDGTPAAQQKQFAYGERVYLNLDTEGINGYKNLTIEIYAHKTLAPDPLTRTIVGVDVTDGEINLEINNTLIWYGKHLFPKEVMEFYVKVKLPNGRYIKDHNGDIIHARYLRIKPQQVFQMPEPPKNTTALKVGNNKTNLKNYHPCKLSKVQLTEAGNPFYIFEEGETLLKKQRTTLKRVCQSVYFDYDEYHLRNDARKTLDLLLDFLLYNPFLNMILEGHADDRGSLDYNQTLSEKRAHSVKNYLLEKGLKDERIKTRGFGEARNAIKATTEIQHAKNRRTIIEFNYNEYDSNAIVYQTLAGSALKPKNITLTLIDHDTVKCMRNHDPHQKEIQIQVNEEKVLVKGSQVNMSIKSSVPPHFTATYLSYLIQYLTPGATLNYSYYINFHTCAYFADKTYPSLQMLIYPDLVWIANLQYNFKEKGDYFFHDKKLELEQGIEPVLKEFKESTFYKMLSILPEDWVTNTEDKIEKNVIVKYLYDETKKFLYGAHVIHDRDIEKAGEVLVLKGTEVNLITQTKYTRYVAALGILYLVALGVVVELVLIYLTRGRNLKGKIAKIASKVKTIKNALDKAGIEINPASVAVYGGMYYYQQKDKRIAIVYEAGIKADPLLEIQYEQGFDLVDMLKTSNDEIKGKKTKSQVLKENTTEVLDILKKAKIFTVKGKVTITANIACDIKVKFNSLTKEYSIIDNLGNFVNTAKQEVVFKEQIQVKIELTSDLKAEFKFYRLESKLEAHIKVKMNGAAALKTHFAVGEGVGFYIEKTLLFSGIKGTFTGNVKNKSNIDMLDYEYEPNKGKPIAFTLIDPYEIPLGKIHLFNPNEK